MTEEHASLGFMSPHDPYTWVTLAALLFAALLYVKARKPILSQLDARTERIKNDLDEAERLRVEAQELLADCQKKHRDAVETAKKIIDTAKDSAERLRKEAEEKLGEQLKQREKVLLERIARAEAAAVRDVREQAASVAAETAEKLLQELLAKNGSKLVDDAIKELPGRLN